MRSSREAPRGNCAVLARFVLCALFFRRTQLNSFVCNLLLLLPFRGISKKEKTCVGGWIELATIFRQFLKLALAQSRAPSEALQGAC